MNAKILACGAVLISLAGGCIPTLNPVYTEKDLVFEPSVLGAWTQPNNDSVWRLEKRDDTSYRLLITEKGGARGQFIAHLANMEGALFLDLFPEEIEGDASGLYKLHLVPIHTVYRVNKLEPTLELAAVDFNRLEKLLSERPRAVEHINVSGGKLITAPPDKVRQFVLKNQDLFTAEFSLARLAESAPLP